MNNAVEKIESFQKFGSVLGLERMTSLMELLGNPQDDLKYVHVAGTNGKGSICMYIYETLQAAGYKTGLYTSPFLEVFNERIQFDGKNISDEDLSRTTEKVLEKVKVMTDRGEDSPTEFEIITAIAFLYFKEKNADIVVLEVGLGGIGDSTNIIKDPLVSVIASISFDHTDRLGKTLAEIAGNKAGIIKEGCPVVTSASSEEALEVFRKKASDCHTMVLETKDIKYEITKKDINCQKFSCTIFYRDFEDIEISMLGDHQIENAICALSALCTMEFAGDIEIPDESYYEGFKKAKQIGRFEIMSENPYVILDGAHNPDGARTLYQTMTEHFSDKNILMVSGMLADKDTDLIVETFTKITKDFVATEPDNPRKMDCEALKEKLERNGASATAIKDYKDAVEYAFLHKDEYDVILMAGSLYLIGGIRALLH